MTRKFASAASTTIRAAALGDTHGYRVEGDVAILNARIAQCRSEVSDCDWRMQLWACHEPFNGGHLSGIKVADIPIGNVATAPTHLTACGLATPPANADYHNMVLVLAAQDTSQFATIHDYANYPLQQSFALPRMLGQASYCFDDNQVRIDVAAIENPRDVGNISGTLSLELWALPERYDGGDFTGTELAGACIGQLVGQSTQHNVSLVLPLNQATKGLAYVTLMLREWTTAGYVTRDYVSFADPVQFAATDLQTNPELDKQHNTNKMLSTLLSATRSSATNQACHNENRDSSAFNEHDIVRSRGRGRKWLAKLLAVAKSRTQH